MCGVAFLLAMVVLGSFTGVVLNAASTLFICFVSDRDAAAQSGSSYGGGVSQQASQPAHVTVIHGAFLTTHPPKMNLQEGGAAGGGGGGTQSAYIPT